VAKIAACISKQSGDGWMNIASKSMLFREKFLLNGKISYLPTLRMEDKRPTEAFRTCGLISGNIGRKRQLYLPFPPNYRCKN
jgi:hypothetical protein